jgi:mannosyltransferase OCH1-like enzyme
MDLWDKYISLFQLHKINSTFSTHFRKRINNINLDLNNEKECIPKKIFRIWQTEMCEKMQYYSDILKNENPDFEYTIFNTEMAREFLKEHFDPEILYTFDSLVPFSYKADLFRYCVLYIHGGIYLDMKFQSVNRFRFSQVIYKEQYTLDIDETSVYNAFLICKPRSKMMFKCIFQVVKNAKERNYTENDLTVTGPGMIKYLITKELKQESKLRHQCMNYNKYILRDGVPILKNYHRYYEDTPKCGQKNYLEYWRNREVFVDPPKE